MGAMASFSALSSLLKFFAESRALKCESAVSHNPRAGNGSPVPISRPVHPIWIFYMLKVNFESDLHFPEIPPVAALADTIWSALMLKA
jgi:hypothetical protein